MVDLLNSGEGENTVGGVAGRPTSTSTSGDEAAGISSEGSKASRQWKTSLEGEEGMVDALGGGRVLTGVGVLNAGDECTFGKVSDKALAIFGCFSCLLSFS